MEDNKVEINGQEFVITPLNAKKTAYIANLFGQLLLKGKLKAKEFKDIDGSALPFAILASVDEKMLITLAAAIIGCDEKFAEENFDLDWIMQALVVQTRVSKLDSVIRNFTALVTQIA